MAASDERTSVEADATEPTTPETTPEGDDTEGHTIASYEYARLHTQEKAREADDWARKQAVRKQARGLIDRLRGR